MVDLQNFNMIHLCRNCTEVVKVYQAELYKKRKTEHGVMQSYKLVYRVIQTKIKIKGCQRKMLQDRTFCLVLTLYGRLEDNLPFKMAQEDLYTRKKSLYSGIHHRRSPAMAFSGYLEVKITKTAARRDLGCWTACGSCCSQKMSIL